MDPTTLLKEIFGAFDAYRGVRLVALGESQVGKTTFWHYARHNSPPKKEYGSTQTIEDLGKFAVHDITVGYVAQRVRAFDVPGQLRDTWGDALKAANPHGILFMCDHSSGEGREADPGRLRAHREAFNHVHDLIGELPLPALERVAIVVNKADLWRSAYTRQALLREAGLATLYPALQAERGGLGVAVREMSALYGDNVRSVLSFLSGK